MLDFSQLGDGGFGEADVTIRAYHENGKVSLYALAEFTGTQQMAAGEKIVFQSTEPGEMTDELCVLSQRSAEDLMTDLWNSGIRPRGVDLADKSECEKELKAVKAHLSDVRNMMMAFWNKINGAPTALGIGKPLPLDKDLPTGSLVKMPGAPRATDKSGDDDNG